MNVHADVHELIDYAGGRLPTERLQQLRRHCTECEECGDRLAAILVLRDAQVPPVARSYAGRAAMALAAAATLAALALGVWSVVRSPAASDVPAASALAATDDLQEPLQLLLWTVDLHIGRSPYVAAGARGEAAAAEAITLMRGGEFGRAAALMAAADDGGLSRLLFGVAMVHAGDGAAARAPLEQAVRDLSGSADATALVQAARLYLGEALLQAGDLAASRARFQELAKRGDERDAFADAAARRLETMGREAAAR